MRTYLPVAGIFFLMAFRVSAQGGSTPVNGQNPVSSYSTSVLHSTDPVSPQDGSGVLGATYSNSQCGLNYTTASNKIGQRFVISCCPATNGVLQPAPFAISGIPSTAVIEKAYVWCDASGNGVPITITVTNPFSTTANFPMTMIGSGPDKCWGYSGTYTYRADVTSLVVGNGNYDISGFPVDPSAASHSNDVDGATMIVIWSDPTQSWQGDIVLWDGCVVINGGTTTQTMTGFTACSAATSNARAFVCVGDMQQLGSQLTLNGVFPVTANPEDWWNCVDVATTVTPGQTTASFGNSAGGDCYNFCVMGLYWQSTCQTCCANPFTLDMDSIPSQCSATNGEAIATPVGGSGTFTYLWNTIPAQTNDTATGLGPGTYVVTVTDVAGCQSVDSVTVLGTGSMSDTATQTNNLCFGDTSGTATLTPTSGSPPYTYTWTPNVSTTGTAINLGAGVYTVDVTDLYGCQSSHTFTITEPPNVPINAAIAGTSPICYGSSSSLTASAAGGAPPYAYSWIAPAPVSSSTTVTVSPTITTTYSVIVTDACNTAPDTATFTVVVNPLPVINFSGDDLNGCVPLCVNFTGSSNPAIQSCSWNFGDNSTATGTNPWHCYYNSGTYDVTLHVNDINGCKDSLTQNSYINVYPLPVAGFNFLSNNPATLLEANIAIDDISTGGDTCYWDFGDGNSLTVIGCGDVSNNYADTGAYHVVQIVVNNEGCRDTIAYDVYIVPYTTLYIPNTFTPNGNGNNEFFLAVGEFVNDFHMMVFDRWGNMIFESNDQLKGWDGKANGGKDLAQVDTYVYVVTYSEQYGGRKHKIIGHVNLIR